MKLASARFLSGSVDMSESNPTSDRLSGSGAPAPHVRMSLKNTFINVDDDDINGELSMPDLLRAQTTPAVFNALQALYSGTQQAGSVAWPLNLGMPPVPEHDCTHEEAAPPPFDAEDVLRQLSELTETLSAMNYDGSSSEPPSPAPPAVVETTVMLRNIPNKYTGAMLMEQFGQFGFTTSDINFFYLPIDFRNVCNVGFAFVNFRSGDRAQQFMHTFENYQLPATNSAKICTVCWARIQGLDANVAHYRDSPIAAEYRPWLFDSDGQRLSFPDPDPAVLASIEKSSKEAIRASNATKGPDQNKIFVGGLDKEVGGAELVEYFSKFGPVRDAAVVIDRTSGKSRGFGFCLFEKFVPKAVLIQTHVIKGTEVAVKMYDGGPATPPGGRNSKHRSSGQR